MATLTALERRLTRVERRVAHSAPSHWGACAPPPLSMPALREVLKILIASTPVQVPGDDAVDEQVKAGDTDATG